MRIVHKLGHRAIKKEGEGSFLLSNKAGSYLSLGTNQNSSYFQGWCFIDSNMDLFKVVENIYLEKEVTVLENHFSNIKRLSGDSSETFFLTSKALLYEVDNYEGFINLELDFRNIYDFDDKGRIYDVTKKGDYIIIHYKKHSDSSLINIHKQYYLVIRGADSFEKICEWTKKKYSYDKKRNDRYEFHIFKALKIFCPNSLKLIFAHADSEKKAIDKCKFAFDHFDFLKQTLITHTKKLLKNEDFAYDAALKSLDDLTVILGEKNKKEGVLAGFPWFFQFWSRDELISLKAWILQERYSYVKKRLFEYLDEIQSNGRLPNRLPESKLDSADSIGWLFKRFYDLLQTLYEKNLVNDYFSEKELELIKHKLHFCIEEHILSHMENYLIINKEKETWMDTSFNDDGRAGERIEIQALFLNFFKLMKLMCKLLDLPFKGYKDIEKTFVKKIKKVFFKEGMLLDGYNNGFDKTVRPNVFIAYYVYPELLRKFEWMLVFKKAIRALWLDWGGISSIDKNSPLFVPYHSGTDNKSYHRGDSWFFMNSLVAISMLSLDKQKFKYFVEKIISASKDEILFSGFIGHHAEISSALEMRSEGCLSQAWSSALFLELMHCWQNL
ncbi:MAG: amylo-alpha-1,6-glucosidase [Nanoarchaeota archaeon]|nr:hypothetical protein [Nanoarchaeota archaeon]MBU1030372.1 hypothetical protein [Nanoarchaeota archaeon]MBU1850287.1 hypothetical protein [Nanoarchaeota archaeon]